MKLPNKKVIIIVMIATLLVIVAVWLKDVAVKMFKDSISESVTEIDVYVEYEFLNNMAIGLQSRETINMDFATNGEFIFCYDEKNIRERCTEEELSIICEIFDGKSLYKDDLSCGFREEISIKINDEQTFCIACDSCTILYWQEEGKYFRISEDEMKQIYKFFEQYGAEFPCVQWVCLQLCLNCKKGIRKMQKIKVVDMYTTDIVCVPDIIVDNLQKCSNDFFEWVSGVSFDEKITDASCYGTKEFIYYLNDRFLSDYSEKAFIEVENYVPQTDKEVQELKKMKKICL